MKLTKLILTTTFCLWGLLSASAWSLNHYDSRELHSDAHLQSIVHHSFDWQNILAEEESGDENEVKHQVAHFDYVGVYLEVSGTSVPSINQNSLPPANVLKAFSLFHQFF